MPQPAGAEDEGFPRLPIDYFLRTLAEDCRQGAVCTILGGTGTDGTLGLGRRRSLLNGRRLEVRGDGPAMILPAPEVPAEEAKGGEG